MPDDGNSLFVHIKVHEANIASTYLADRAQTLSIMLYTFLRFVFLVCLFYVTLLITRSIYQATFPISSHNRGEVIDYGAEFLQELIQVLRIYYPRFDYFLNTVNQVLAQILLTVTMRYKVNIAMYTGGFIAFAAVASAIVAGKLLCQVLWTMRRLMNLTSRLVVDFLMESLVDYLIEFYENLRIMWWLIRKIWGGKKIAPFHARSRKQDTTPAAEERQRAPKPDHTRPPSGGQGPRRGRSAPPRSAEIDPDEELRRFARRMEKDMQDLYGDANTPRGRRGREGFVDEFRRKMGINQYTRCMKQGIELQRFQAMTKRPS